MSTSIAIPRRRKSLRSSASQASVPSPSSVSYQSTPSTTPTFGSSSGPMNAEARRFGKSKAQDSPSQDRRTWDRRPSLLGSSLSKSEYTVVNLGHSDGPPRLVTCVKSSQGFDWNQELFLPSYMDFDSDLERRPDPVHDITLTDEEAAALLP